MRIMQAMPYVAALVVLVSLLVTGLWHEKVTDAPAYQSPCIVSWDEEGHSTFCILTNQAAELEHKYGRIGQ